MTQLPPFDINEVLPGNSDIVSQYPAVERLYRDVVESWIQFEHHTSGHHEFKVDTTTNLDADSTWPAGSFRYNTTLAKLQFAISAGPLVWRSIGPDFQPGDRAFAQQTTAPLGWIKEAGAAYNDAAIRTVTGSVLPTGGTAGFEATFASRTPAGTVGGTAITKAQLPTDRLFMAAAVTVVPSSSPLTASNQWAFSGDTGDSGRYVGGGSATEATIGRTSPMGSGATHDHSFTGTAIDFDVKHVDAIVIIKS